MACNLFQSTPPARGATLRPPRRAGQRPDFNPRPPRGGRQQVFCKLAFVGDISIHAPREGGDSKALQPVAIHFYFNPRPPRGGRRQAVLPTAPPYMHFNPRPPRGGRLRGPGARVVFVDFNPRPPARGATVLYDWLSFTSKFQSTPPARGATSIPSPATMIFRFQSTPPARGATIAPYLQNSGHGISIHAPREGGD